MPSKSPNKRQVLTSVVAGALACTLSGLATSASAQGLGANPSAPPPVADGVVAPTEGSSAAFAGALASADPSTGAGRASYPFRLETARGKSQPSLGLDYSSTSGQREAGVGWGLTLPSIQRRNLSGGPNYAMDPTAASPLSSATDRFVFGGVSLVPICQVTAAGVCVGAPSGETMPTWAVAGWSYFRAEVDRTFERFFWSADHLTWVVEERSGEVREFGVPLDAPGDESACDMDQSKVVNPDGTTLPGGVFRWNLVRQHDAMGTVNEIQYVWSNVNGAQRAYLTDIYDTPVTSAYVNDPKVNAPPFAHHTHLTWTADQPLPQVMWPRMFRATPDQVLSRVDITSATYTGTAPRALVRSYALTYYARGTLGLNWWRTALESVQVTGACAGVVEDASGDLPASLASCPTMPATGFGYTQGYPEVLVTNTAGASLWQSMGTVEVDGTFVDVDGDGAVDIVHAPNWPGENDPDVEQPQYYANLLNAFSSAGQVDMVETGIGDGNMPSEIFNAVQDYGNDPQRYYTLVGNFGLTSSYTPGADVFTYDTTASQYMLFSIAASHTGGSAVALMNAETTSWFSGTSVMQRQFEDGPDVIEAQTDIDGDGFIDWTGIDSPNGYSVVYTSFSTLSAAGQLSLAASSIPDQAIGLVTDGGGDLYSTPTFLDANGDGLPDVVTGGCVDQTCSFVAALGKGDGTYNGAATWALPPYYAGLVIAGDAFMYLHDVNGDGVADLILNTTSGILIFFANGILSDGTVNLVVNSLTQLPLLIAPPPSATSWDGGDALRFADVNASGVDDIVVMVTQPAGNLNASFQPATLYYVDLLGGGPPPLLSAVGNGLGASTTLTYDTTAHLSALANDGGPTSAWTSQSPQNTHVVTGTTTSLGPAGILPGNSYAGGPYVTSYEYANPVYDKRFREFRGFGLVRTIHVDSSNPNNDDVVETSFLSTQTQNTGVDVPWNALTGLPVLSTTYAGSTWGLLNAPSTEAPGAALSTTHIQYNATAIVAGLDGRVVRTIYPSETDVWHYDSSTPMSGAPGPALTVTDVYETEIGGVVGGPIASSSLVLLMGGSATIHHTSTSTYVDTHGSVTSQIDNGSSDLDDTAIARTSTWISQGDWNWRPQTSQVGYPTGTQRLFTFGYDAYGNETSVTTTVSGVVALARNVSATPVHAESNGAAQTVTTMQPDAYGNVVTSAGANGTGLTTYVYDPGYAQLLIQKSVYPNGSSGAALTSYWTYDRGFEEALTVTGVDGAVTTMTYDAFGRIASVALPDPVNVGTSDAPDFVITYADVAGGPFQLKTVEQRLDAAGDVRTQVSYVDALGRAVVNLSSGGAADPAGSWIATGLTQRDAKGRVVLAYAPYPVTDPSEADIPTVSDMTMRTLSRDPFGRVSEVLDLDGTPAVLYEYRALGRDTYDANAIAALGAGGTPNYSSVKLDGHGRVIEADERTQNGGGASGTAEDTIVTTTTYQATGEPLTITRASTNNGGNTYSRSMTYDSLGRMVTNLEPNTSLVSRLAATKLWVYAYDLNGQLVGTSDARGCGVNYTYDGVGRVTSEDYLPCETTQPAYSAPGAAGIGTEVYNVYDTIEPSEPALNVGLTPALAGRLVATYSRGEHTNYAYDGRGRVVQVARQMPTPSAETATGALSGRYDPWWYRTSMLYDEANRRVGQTTGSDVTQLGSATVAGYTNLVTATYDARDIAVQVGGSYGALVSSEQHYPNGLLESRTYGDNAGTVASYTYDGRQNLKTATVQRAFDNLWFNSPGAYYPLPYTGGTSAYTTPLTLQKLGYTADAVNNPHIITDGRLASEWPTTSTSTVNAGPLNETVISYDDRYRVTSATYTYAGGAEETQAANFTSTDPPPISFETPAYRAGSQGYQYDWQGNITLSTDDANALLQRSGGTATYGTNGITPNRIASGSNANGSYTTTYDYAGNLLSITGSVATGTLATLAPTLTYDWDEAGHLRTATRKEVATSGHTSTTTTMSNAYLYDGGGQRTWHSSNNTGAEAYTLEVFPSLQLQGTTFNSGAYTRSFVYEAPYLVVGGSSYGRLVFDWAKTLPSPKDVPLHVYLQITDPLGSTSSTIDRDSSELVEQITYLAYGQTETDYRPTRWRSFREGYRYTGKEDDYDVGLTYFGARYYVPGLNRWASADPLAIHGVRGDINPYSFVRGSPFLLVDPTGLNGGTPTNIDPSTTQTWGTDSSGATQYGASVLSPGDGNQIEYWQGPAPSTGGPSGGSSGGDDDAQTREREQNNIQEGMFVAYWANEEFGDWAGIAAVAVVAYLNRNAHTNPRASSGVPLELFVGGILPARGAGAAEGTGQAIISEGKFGYLFGEASGNAHNVERALENASQLSRVGVYNNAEGQALLQAHFDAVVGDSSNIISSTSNQYGSFVTRESLFAGPGGFVKFESTWQVLEDGAQRFITAIPFGGP